MKLQISNLVKKYGEKTALDHLNLELEDGIYGLLGPNGAGKSTLMNILTRNLSQNEGEILLDGKSSAESGDAWFQKIGYMPQTQAYYPDFTGEQFLYYIGSLKGLSKSEAKAAMTPLLQQLALYDVRRNLIRSYSGGMRQRLLLAQAMLGNPDILILDEPTAGMDPRQRIAVRNLIAEFALHKIVIISTHVVSDVEFIAKEIVLLSAGKMIDRGSAEELSRKMEGRVVEIDCEEKDLEQIASYGIVSSIGRHYGKIRVRLIKDREQEEIPFDSVPVEAGLEDVYLDHFGEEGL